MSATEQDEQDLTPAPTPAPEPAAPRGTSSGIPVLAVADPDAEQQMMPNNRSWARSLFVGVWLLYLIPTLQQAWQAPQLEWRIVGVAAIAAFSALYVAVFLWIRRIRVGFLVEPSWYLAWGVLGLGLALMLLALPAAGESALAMIIYLAVLVMFLLPPRWAVTLVVIASGLVALLTNTLPGWSPQDQLSLQILITALAIWGIIQMLQRNNQLAQARAELTDLAISQERMRFSRDLHDILGHTLTVITLKAELAGRLVQLDPARAEHEIAEVERLARTALVDVRATVAGYRDVSLAVELASARTALDAAESEADLAGAVDDVPADRRELFGWAVREGVTNVVRHSGAERCRVSVGPRVVEIADDGRGPGGCQTQATAEGSGGGYRQAGHGLAGLRERCEAAGAQLSIGRATEGGFLLRVTW